MQANLSSVLQLLVTVTRVLGMVLLGWGGIGIGLAIKDGQGMSMDTNVGKVIGGALIVAMSVVFGNIDLGQLQ